MAVDNDNSRVGYRFHSYPTEAAYVQAVASEIAASLTESLKATGGARLLASGGTTPGAIYAELARIDLGWQAIDVGLVDERWVPDLAEREAASNQQLLEKTLLNQHAASARFSGLADYRIGLAESVKDANRRHELATTTTVVLLGMGEDAHTASLFPGAVNLPEALASDDAYVSLDATGCKVAGRWMRRITLTPHGFRTANRRILLIRGETKRQVFERAVERADVIQFPVLSAIVNASAPLDVFWCP
jgi:6-phosphogluconolactonase